MKLLLDTHAFLWAAFSPRKLSARARAAVVDSENAVAVSSLSFWELSLKFSLGKITLEGCTPDELPEVARQMSFEILQADASDMASFHALPRLAHKDPFDRMIIWQAIRQGWTLVSKDAAFEAYRDHGLSVWW
jgi:PIN domain nuclease of toxin-antitoxin system